MNNNGTTLTIAVLISQGKASASSFRNFWKEAEDAGLVSGVFDRNAQLTQAQFDWFEARCPNKKAPKNGAKVGTKRRKSEVKLPELRPNTGQKPEQKPAEDGANAGAKGETETAGNWIKSRWFLVTAMLLLFAAQAIHTSGFFWHNTPVEEVFGLRLSLAILCGIGLDTVALVMTAHGGGKSYLYIFASFHFVINMLFHSQQYLMQAFEDLTWFEFGLKFMGAGVLSGALAYGLFSYTELFTKAFRTNG